MNVSMHEVTREQFFAALYGDQRDIMPTIINSDYPYTQEWRTNDWRRSLFGESRGDRYWLASDR